MRVKYLYENAVHENEHRYAYRNAKKFREENAKMIKEIKDKQKALIAAIIVKEAK